MDANHAEQNRRCLQYVAATALMNRMVRQGLWTPEQREKAIVELNEHLEYEKNEPQAVILRKLDER